MNKTFRYNYTNTYTENREQFSPILRMLCRLILLVFSAEFLHQLKYTGIVLSFITVVFFASGAAENSMLMSIALTIAFVSSIAVYLMEIRDSDDNA